MVTTSSLPLLFVELETLSVERLSPSFVRVVLGSPELADYGIEGPRYDQRIKLIFPGARQTAPAALDEESMQAWWGLPEEERGHMRTYTIRDVLGSGRETRFVVDIVVHEDGLAGPGGSWALRAVPGDRVQVMAPRRGVPFGGIEFAPPQVNHLLLVGDETALPAIASILADLDATSVGRVFLEVPDVGDILDLAAPPGMELCWLPRGHTDAGARLVPAIRAHFGLGAGEWATDAEIDPDLWETPTWSSSGADLDQDARSDGPLADLYAWIAGESRMVTTLRRALVKELGVERSQVAFMGYWRKGVSMKS
ncbi:siderophore-interacting protein [Nocardioides marmoriginsengisoli]|uniref:Siderophore-interacting protein n=1 Tax=Nocardioides marmoriginsengisoli TaxID=661483 RepID=A0A3N0CGF8_9ACTN|nr:siderophore-interacting protein [Nocardioides marmoriginsengisoli]RNL62550.1 siderophore-interacting protein [Nocardioides marmoriginsengisoli]